MLYPCLALFMLLSHSPSLRAPFWIVDGGCSGRWSCRSCLYVLNSVGTIFIQCRFFFVIFPELHLFIHSFVWNQCKIYLFILYINIYINVFITHFWKLVCKYFLLILFFRFFFSYACPGSVDGGTVYEDVRTKRIKIVTVSFNMDLFTAINYVYFHRKHLCVSCVVIWKRSWNTRSRFLNVYLYFISADHTLHLW